MDIVMQGVVHGKTIELDTSPGIEDGRRVELVVRVKQLSGPPAWEPGSTETAAGMMASFWTEEDDRILEGIYQDRKKRSRREMPE